MAKKLEDKIKTAEWTLYYVKRIADKFSFKLNNLSNPYEEFKVLIQDDIHSYDSDAIKLMTKTYKRKNFNINLFKFRKTEGGKYAYIFKASRIK